MSQGNRLISIPANHLQETLRVLQEAGVTQDDFQAIRAGGPQKVAADIKLALQGVIPHLERLRLCRRPDDQIEAWRRANREGKFRIGKGEFEGILKPRSLTQAEILAGIIGPFLFYRFIDPVKSLRTAFGYGRGLTTAWDMIFDGDIAGLSKSGSGFQLFFRDDLSARPKGFFWANLQIGDKSLRGEACTVIELEKQVVANAQKDSCYPASFELAQLFMIIDPLPVFERSQLLCWQESRLFFLDGYYWFGQKVGSAPVLTRNDPLEASGLGLDLNEQRIKCHLIDPDNTYPQLIQWARVFPI